MEDSDESRATRVVLYALALPFVGVVFLVVALYVGSFVLFTYAANYGETSRSGVVVAHTMDGRSYDLAPGTHPHYEGDDLLDGHHVLKIVIKRGPFKGMNVVVPEGSIIVYGKSVYP